MCVRAPKMLDLSHSIHSVGFQTFLVTLWSLFRWGDSTGSALDHPFPARTRCPAIKGICETLGVKMHMALAARIQDDPSDRSKLQIQSLSDDLTFLDDFGSFLISGISKSERFLSNKNGWRVTCAPKKRSLAHLKPTQHMRSLAHLKRDHLRT